MKPTALTTRRKLLTHSWTADVSAVEAAIDRFADRRPLTNGCRVTLFEVARDPDLHVNVTHRHPTVTARGWAGPAVLPDGFVHNRTFDHTSSGGIARHIRDMVFAERR